MSPNKKLILLPISYKKFPVFKAQNIIITTYTNRKVYRKHAYFLKNLRLYKKNIYNPSGFYKLFRQARKYCESRLYYYVHREDQTIISV